MVELSHGGIGRYIEDLMVADTMEKSTAICILPTLKFIDRSRKRFRITKNDWTQSTEQKQYGC